MSQAIGAKPLKTTNPNNDSTFVASRPKGIEISASCAPRHRALRPTRREGRIWLTYVDSIWIDAGHPLVTLPEGFAWDRLPEQGLRRPSPK